MLVVLVLSADMHYCNCYCTIFITLVLNSIYVILCPLGLKDQRPCPRYTITVISIGLEWKIFGFERTSAKGTGMPPGPHELKKYIPPEGTGGSEVAATSSDVWGLGCLVWEVFVFASAFPLQVPVVVYRTC